MLKIVLNNRELGINANKCQEGVIVPTALYGAETWGAKKSVFDGYVSVI